jgi:SAM-dependent methyltransferase
MSAVGAPEGASAYWRLSGPAYRGEFAARYGQFRPRPPEDLFALLLSLAPPIPPDLVVDLGAGTGSSTAPWSGRARRVVGIDINPDMLGAAVHAPGIGYVRANALRTGLANGCADIVTCAQSFHWLDAGPAIAEIARILRPGGLFAAYDYDWPPLIDWQVDAELLRVIEAAGVDPGRPEKARHVQNLRQSGRFRAVREVFLHARQAAQASEIAQLPRVFGPVARRLDEGATERDLGLDRYQEAVRSRLKPGANTMWWSYRVRLAVT